MAALLACSCASPPPPPSPQPSPATREVSQLLARVRATRSRWDAAVDEGRGLRTRLGRRSVAPDPERVRRRLVALALRAGLAPKADPGSPLGPVGRFDALGKGGSLGAFCAAVHEEWAPHGQPTAGPAPAWGLASVVLRLPRRPPLPPPPTPPPAAPDVPAEPSAAVPLLRRHLLALERALAEEESKLGSLRADLESRTRDRVRVRCGYAAVPFGEEPT